MTTMVRGIRNFLEFIKFEHTIFALPFAYVGMLLAAGGFPAWPKVVWITVAMAAARTMAMATNRLADRVYDAQNPRTASRPLVSGRITAKQAWIGLGIATVVLVIAAWRLGPLPLKLLPLALFFLVGYSFTKRFTWLANYMLGFTDGLAAIGAWVAIRGSLFTSGDLAAWLLLATVTFWMGGVDTIYACQDAEVDRVCGLHAIPARFGVPAALQLSALSHTITLGLLAAVGFVNGLAWPYAVGLVVIAVLLVVEHRLVSPKDLTRINVAFFNVNGIISITLFLSVAASYLVAG
jgi:4-hydroxybenzoate polyprenyltransferase